MKRENNLDFLRVIACVMVISIHVSCIYVNKYAEIPNFKFTVGNFYDSFTRLAVPIFVLLSGRFALSDERNAETKYYYKKFFSRIIVPTVVWSFLYFMYSYSLKIMSYLFYGELKNIFSPIKAWIIGAPYYHLWYLYMSIGLYLSVPYLLKLKKKIGEENFFKTGIIFFILGLFIFLFEKFLNYINFYNRDDIFKYLKYFWCFNQLKFISYMGYFILGYSLKNKNINFKKMIFSTITFLTFMFLTVEILVRKEMLCNPDNIYSNNFIFTMGGAVSIYLAFNNLKSENIKFDFSNLAFHSFNIYLVHAGILSVITIFLDKILNYEPNPIWYIPFMICFIFVISYIFSIILENIKKRFIKNN